MEGRRFGLALLLQYNVKVGGGEGRGGILSPLGMIQVRQFHSYSNIMLIMYIVIQGKISTHKQGGGGGGRERD